MKNIQIKSKKLLSFLNEYKDYCDELKDADIHEKYWEHMGPLIADENIHGVSKEYLDIALKNDNAEAFNWPNRDKLLALETIKFTPEYKEHTSKAMKLNRRFMAFMGLQYNALLAIYPPKGYIGWHHNGKATGLNVLFTYSEKGDGYFKYRDPKTKEIVTVNDKPGWQMKMGYYPSCESNDIDDLFWHCAYTEEYRYSVAFIVDDKNMKDSLKEIATNEN